MHAADYRRQAEHYLICARHMSEPDAQATLTDIATYWMNLAKRAEQNEPVAQRRIVMSPPLQPHT